MWSKHGVKKISTLLTRLVLMENIDRMAVSLTSMVEEVSWAGWENCCMSQSVSPKAPSLHSHREFPRGKTYLLFCFNVYIYIYIQVIEKLQVSHPKRTSDMVDFPRMCWRSMYRHAWRQTDLGIWSDFLSTISKMT